MHFVRQKYPKIVTFFLTILKILSFIKPREKNVQTVLKTFFAILDLQFLTCNSWFAILDLQFLTCNSWQEGTEYHVPRQGTKCATAWHKKTFKLMCHGKAQNVPQYGTKCTIARHKKTFKLMCHGKAQNVPQYGTKCDTVRHKMCHSTAQKYF
jgi:hypothetical protein